MATIAWKQRYELSLFPLTLRWPLGFRDFQKKTPKRMWLCVGISPVRYALQT